MKWIKEIPFTFFLAIPIAILLFLPSYILGSPLEFWDIMLRIACVLYVAIPPQYDPVILLREWLDR